MGGGGPVETKSMRDWSKSPAELKARRVKAARLLRQGKNLSEVARVVKASVSSVYRWKQALKQSGMKGLDGKQHTGPRRKLTPSQRANLKVVFLQGAGASGYGCDRWEGKHILELIKRRYGITFCLNYIARLLRSIGLSESDLTSQGYGHGGKRCSRRSRMPAFLY